MSWRRRILTAVLVGGAAASLSGCAAVKPYEREFLADPIMAADGINQGALREQKWLEAREGSTGGAGGAGGGCACN